MPWLRSISPGFRFLRALRFRRAIEGDRFADQRLERAGVDVFACVEIVRGWSFAAWKNVLRIRYDQPLPEDLIRRIAEHSVQMVSEREDDGFW